jgi:hypothetical protein
MATYVGLIQFADQGIRNIKDTVKRGDAAMAEAEKMGMKFVAEGSRILYRAATLMASSQLGVMS